MPMAVEQEARVLVLNSRLGVCIWGNSWISAGLQLLICLGREENRCLLLPLFYDFLVFQAYSVHVYGESLDNRLCNGIQWEYFLWLPGNLENMSHIKYPLQSQMGSKEIKTRVWGI